MHIEYLQYPRHRSQNWGHSDDKRDQMPWNGHCAGVSRRDTPKPKQWEDPVIRNDKSSRYLGPETAILLDRKPLFYPLWVFMFSLGFSFMWVCPSGLASSSCCSALPLGQGTPTEQAARLEIRAQEVRREGWLCICISWWIVQAHAHSCCHSSSACGIWSGQETC